MKSQFLFCSFARLVRISENYQNAMKMAQALEVIESGSFVYSVLKNCNTPRTKLRDRITIIKVSNWQVNDFYVLSAARMLW